MEKKLQTLIENFDKLVDIQNLDELNPIKVTLTHPTLNTSSVFVCSYTEPYRLTLPLNVVWLDFNPMSINYRKALIRVSKDADATTGRTHTWSVIETYDEAFATQYYDTEDTAKLSTQNEVPIATTAVAGVAKLSYPSSQPTNPTVVVEGDPRLSDPREPKAHTHPEQPVTQIKTADGTVTVSGSDAPEVGATIVATSATTATWRRLTTDDLVQ